MAAVVFIDLIGRNDGRGPRDAMNMTISHLPGVIASAYKEGVRIGAKAENRIHHAPDPLPDAVITVEQAEVDTHVNLVHPAAMSIEFGHFALRDEAGRFTDIAEGTKYSDMSFIPGQYIVRGAAGIV